MTLNVPLTLRVKTGRTDHDLTGVLRDLRFRSTAYGGFANIEASFDHPLVFRPDEVSYFANVYVYDGRNNRVVCEGRLEDPERSAGASGEIWGLTAIGPAAHASDRTIPYVPVDKSLQRWTRIPNSSTFLTATPDSQTTADGYRLQFERGAVVPTGDHGGIEYRTIEEAGQKLGRISYTYSPDNADANWHHKVFAFDAGGGGGGVADTAFSGGAGSLSRVVVTDWANGRTRPQIGLSRTTSSVTIADDVTRVWLTSMVVRSMLVDVNGADRTPTGTGSTLYSYSTDTVLAEDIVRDLLGRLLNKYNGATAKIASSTYNIEQLAYPDGVTAAQVLADLMALEPNTWWAAWESNDAGLYRFEWSTWPTTLDYEASTVDGFDSPGSATDMYNQVTVRYIGAKGAVRTATRNLAVPQLTAAGLTRTAFIDLGDEPGSTVNAQQVADLFLSDHQYPPNRGRLTVSRPILSRSEGRMVGPWEIRPGRLIRVQDIEPTVDGLNATGRDGVTVFRVVSVDYDASSNSATLELDSYVRTTARALAALQSNPALYRRRR